MGRRISQSHIPLHVLCHPRAAGSLISPAPTHRRHPEPSELRPNCAFQPRSATLGPQYAHYTAYIAATHEPIHVPSIQDRRCPDHPPKTHPRHPRPPEPRPNCALEPNNQRSTALGPQCAHYKAYISQPHMSSYIIHHFKTTDALTTPQTPSKAPSTPRTAPELRI